MSKIIMAEGVAPSTPSTGKASIFIDSTGRLSLKDDDGNTDTMAVLATAQTFTAAQTIAPTSTSAHGLEFNMPASTTGNALRMSYNSVLRFQLSNDADDSFAQFVNVDLGNDVTAPFFRNGRNSSAGAVGPSAGTFRYVSAGGTTYSTWVDASGNLRIHTAAPTGSSGAPTVSDTAGTVVGTQTSWHELKQNIVERLGRDELLDAVLNLRLYDFDMRDEHHTGLVIYEDDKGAWFTENAGPQQVPSLNERSLFGHLIGAIQAQQAQIEALTQRITQLEAN